MFENGAIIAELQASGMMPGFPSCSCDGAMQSVERHFGFVLSLGKNYESWGGFHKELGLVLSPVRTSDSS